MLTDAQMRTIAEKYVNFLSQNRSKVELKLFPEGDEQKKTYGSIFVFNTKKYYYSENLDDQVMTTPFLVEKATGRIVHFGSAYPNEYYIKAYEDGILEPSMDRYWYPETETYSSK